MDSPNASPAAERTALSFDTSKSLRRRARRSCGKSLSEDTGRFPTTGLNRRRSKQTQRARTAYVILTTAACPQLLKRACIRAPKRNFPHVLGCQSVTASAKLFNTSKSQDALRLCSMQHRHDGPNMLGCFHARRGPRAWLTEAHRVTHLHTHHSRSRRILTRKDAANGPNRRWRKCLLCLTAGRHAREMI